QVFEPWNAGIKIRCLNRLGDSPTQLVVCCVLRAATNEFCSRLQVGERMMRERSGFPCFPVRRYLFEYRICLLFVLEGTEHTSTGAGHSCFSKLSESLEGC